MGFKDTAKNAKKFFSKNKGSAPKKGRGFAAFKKNTMRKKGC